jgi:hypothetical protein
LEKKKEEWPISFLARYRADNECVIWKSGFGCLAVWDLSDDRNVVAHRRNCGKEAIYKAVFADAYRKMGFSGRKLAALAEFGI